MNWYDSLQNIEIMARYLDHRGYGLLDLATMLKFPASAEPTWHQAKLWWAWEQELQRRFNEDAAVILKS